MIANQTQTEGERLQRAAMDANDGATDRLLAAVVDARELTPLERKQADAAKHLKSVQASFPNEKVVACSGCSRPTLGAFGPSGMLWRTVCQTCKDEADKTLEHLAIATAKQVQWTTDRILEHMRRDLTAADHSTKHETGKGSISAPEDAVDPRGTGPVIHEGMPIITAPEDVADPRDNSFTYTGADVAKDFEGISKRGGVA